jgi:hypothetical protein
MTDYRRHWWKLAYPKIRMAGEEGVKEGDVFALKRVHWNRKDTAIVLQSEHGPCPLIALANCLVLRGELELPWSGSSSQLSSSSLLNAVAEHLASRRSFSSTTTDPNSLQSLDDALSCLPSLLFGLDVNVVFHDVEAFEFTQPLSAFDVASVPILHGWVVDSHDSLTSSAVGNRTYNQLVERLVALREQLSAFRSHDPLDSQSADDPSSNASERDDPPPALNKPVRIRLSPNMLDNSVAVSLEADKRRSDNVKGLQSDATTSSYAAQTDASNSSDNALEAEAISAFLEKTSSQLTEAGLTQLYERISENTIFCLFRNNHFNAGIKRDGRIYLLVTDQGYLHEDGVVWELLTSVGSSMLCDNNFQPAFPSGLAAEHFANTAEVAGAAAQSVAAQCNGFDDLSTSHTTGEAGDASGASLEAQKLIASSQQERMEQEQSDLALALHLQQQERESANRAEASRQQAQQPHVQRAEVHRQAQPPQQQQVQHQRQQAGNGICSVM